MTPAEYRHKAARIYRILARAEADMLAIVADDPKAQAVIRREFEDVRRQCADIDDRVIPVKVVK